MGEVQRQSKSRDKSRAAPSAAAPEPARASSTNLPAWTAGAMGAPFALGGVQRKVAIGAPNDAYERQADHVAGHVVGGRTVPPGSISTIAPASIGSAAQRQSKPEEKKPDDKKKDKPVASAPVQKQAKPEQKKKEEKPPAAPVQRAVKPEDKEKDPKAAGGQLQRQSKPDEKKKEEKPAASAPVQKQSKPEEKKKEEKPASPPVQKQNKPEEKKKEEKPAAASPVQKQSKPEEKKKEEKPGAAPVQKQAKPEEKKKEEKPASPPVQKQSKPEEKKKDEKPSSAPVQRETRPEDKKKEEVPGTLPVQRAGTDQPTMKEEEAVQTSRSGSGGAAAAPSMESAAANAIASKGPGEPINSSTRGTLESRMGQDLSDVRVHNDSRAHDAASALNARAFTHQNDIWLGRGESQHNLQLMAHEATHVVQQTGSVHRQLVQREGKTPDPPKDATPATPAGPVGDIKTGLMDPATSSITFEQIEVPAFKAAAHRGKKYAERDKLIRKKDYKRGNPNQRDKWKDKIDATTIKKQLTEKAKPTKEGMPDATKEYVFKVPTRTGGKPFLIGQIEDVAKQLTIPYWGGKSKTPETKLFDVDHTVELQLANWDTDKSANELSNMELLEMSANRSSGGMIANAIDKKVDGFLAKNKDVIPDTATDKEPKKKSGDKGGREQVKLKYDLVFQKAVGVGGPSVGSTDFWTQDQIEKGEHLNPVEASSLDEIGGKGRVLVFSGPGGGLGKTFLWKEADKEPKGPEGNEKEWLKPFTIKSKSFTTSGEGIEKTPTIGTVSIFIPEGDKKWKPYPEEQITVNRIPGARYAGYLNKNQVKSKAEKIEKTGASPIRIDQFDILPEQGIYVAGQILPDLSIIKGAGLDFELRGDELRIFKTFKMEEFKVPKPLTVTNSSLTVLFSTETGFGIEGEVNFGIDRVGEGYLRGGANKKGFNLAGGFSFDSKLFDPAKVDMKYESESDALSISGELGIPEGKVRGLKSANFKVSYDAGVIKASGNVKPDIPVVEQGDISLTYSEKDGLVLAGSLELKKDLPGISGGTIRAEVSKKPGADRYIVKASGEATPKIPGISSKLTVSYDDGAFDATITAGYEKGMLKGSVTVGATNRPVDDSGKPGEAPAGKADKITVYGGGSVTLKLAPWLQATAAIKFKPNGEVEVMGKIGLPSVLDIFDEKKVEKNIFKIGIDIPIFPGIQLNVGGGLDLNAGIGPGQLQDVEVDVTYNPDHEDETNVHGHAALHIPASAGLRMNVHAALGVGIPLAKVEGGIELGGSLGVDGALHAAVDIDWTPKKGLVLDASAEIYAEPKLKFDITGYVDVVVGIGWLSKTLWEKRWKLGEVEYGSGLRFGLKLPIHYEEGKPFNVSLSDIQFEVPNIDAMDTLKGLFDKIV